MSVSTGDCPRENITVTKNRAYRQELIVYTLGGNLIGASARLRVYPRGNPGAPAVDKALTIPDELKTVIEIHMTEAETNGLTAGAKYSYQVDGTDADGEKKPLLRGRCHVGPEYPY